MTHKTLPVIQPPQLQPQQQLEDPILPWIVLNTRRRVVFFIICSPVLLPLLCLFFPLICLSRIYACLCHRRRREKRRRDDGGDGRLRRCEEGRGQEEEGDEVEREIGWMLLHRYLEDQLRLVGSVVAVYDCGQEDEEDGDYYPHYYINNNNISNNGDNCVDQAVNLDENRRPLLV